MDGPRPHQSPPQTSSHPPLSVQSVESQEMLQAVPGIRLRIRRPLAVILVMVSGVCNLTGWDRQGRGASRGTR